MIVMAHRLHVVAFMFVVLRMLMHWVFVLLSLKIAATGHRERIGGALQAVLPTVALWFRCGFGLLHIMACMGVVFMHVSYRELCCQARHFRRRIAVPAVGK